MHHVLRGLELFSEPAQAVLGVQVVEVGLLRARPVCLGAGQGKDLVLEVVGDVGEAVLERGSLAFLFLFAALALRLSVHGLLEKAGIDVEGLDEAGDIGIAVGDQKRCTGGRGGRT